MTIGERIRKRRKQLGLSVDELAEKLGKDRATIYRYESDKIENMSLSILDPLAKALRISPAYLMGWEFKKEEHLESEYCYFPTSISAGLPLGIDSIQEDECEMIKLPDSVMGKWAGKDDIFITRVNGDSMNKIIPHGSLIVVKSVELSELKDNDIVVFSNGGDYSVKRFFHDRENERVIFRPDSHDNRFFDYIVSYENAKSLKIHGKVVLYIVELD
ncbi:XRE family transcriptional regulator [Bacillus badius]|uniref:LexA family protein n=1 Tax=Bacillus badius TaxID=1455 RepID=UPI001CBF0241|nr:XRE family transcriptional regulator [Bacillus badius]UAT29548.1 XRE family transcriptional regulator [Bacillus badius]